MTPIDSLRPVPFGSGLRSLQVSGLYLITDRKMSGKDHEDFTDLALNGGARIIQLREKEMSKNDLLRVALNLREKTERYNAMFIINDHVDIAKASNADGVHLGQEDSPLEDARKILGPDKIIGVSTHNIKEALEAQLRGADYIGLGPIFRTETKNTRIPLGTDIIREVKKEVNIPIVVIGGINLDNLNEVIEAGADAIAVISAIAGSKDITGTVRRFIEKIEALTIKEKR
jgi:thiamine-phosphate pyrophosphorylase